MMIKEKIECPKCSNDSVVEKDCTSCEGYGTDIHDNLCTSCGGTGEETGVWECLGCENEWDDHI